MFKVGDVVTGARPDDYYITTNEATLVVLSVTGNWMRVKLMSHKLQKFKAYIGEEYIVHCDKFVKVSRFKGNMK